MRTFTYETLPGRVVFGVGMVSRLPSEVDRLGARRVLLVTGHSAEATAAELAGLLGERFAGRVSGARPHVPIAAVEAARAAARDARADCLVTIGGGSVTGLGKAVALESGLPIVAIPTTYAGSELTPIYGITSEGRKRTGRDLRVLPKTVIYDPALTAELPAAVAAGSGMNALAHCVEGLYAEGASPLTSIMAEEAIRVLARALPRVVRGRGPGDLEARANALYGTYLAGAVLAAVGMALHHRLCHVLGGTYGLAHGDVNAVLLPHVAGFNAEAVPGALARVALALGTEDAATGLYDFAAAIGAPTSLAALGMSEADLPAAARLAADPPPWNPRPADVRSVQKLLEDAHAGRRPAPRAEVVA